MILSLLIQVLCSLALLLLSGQVLIKTSLKLSNLLRLSTFFIGTIIMGFATSLPELSVSLQAALAGSAEVTLGNVLGSNIANTLLILGLSSMLSSLPQAIPEKKSVYWNVAAHFLLLGCFLFEKLSWPQALLLLIAFTVYCKFIGINNQQLPPISEQHMYQSQDNTQSTLTQIFLLIGSLGVLIYSADLLVQSAIQIATALGVAEKVIAVTIVAIGTSLPEIVMATMASWHQKPELVFSTVLGSNIFNILLIVGAISLLCPLAIPSNLYPDLILACSCSIFLMFGLRLRREVGLVMLSIYVSYIMLVTI